jgi:hypothetical protein
MNPSQPQTGRKNAPNQALSAANRAIEGCEECRKRGWPTRGPVHGVEGQTLCWAHALLDGWKPGPEAFWVVNEREER